MKKDINCIKSTCEKYSVSFNSSRDYAIFIIDNSGVLQCTSSFGDFSYRWRSFGEDFKRFLCEIDSEYLLRKVASEDYFDFHDYQEKAKETIIKERKNNELKKEEARELWNFFENELSDYSNSYDMVCNEVYNNEILYELYSGEVFYTDFCPERSYSPHANIFAFQMFPMFVEILKEEVAA